MSGKDFSFEATLPGEATFVSLMRRFVTDTYNQLGVDFEHSERMGLVTHEMLENTIKHNRDAKSMIHFKVARGHEGDEAKDTIETRNHAATDRVAEVQRFLRQVAQFPNPDELYQILMRRTAKQIVGSGLGLGRIQAEGKMKLSYEYTDEVLRIIAESRTQGRRR